MTRHLLAGLLSCALALPLTAAPAQAGWLWKEREARECGHPHVLKQISSKFRTQARQVHHDNSLAITDYGNIHEHRYLEKSEDRRIARRYCGADVTLSDGRGRTIWYMVERSAGFAAIGDNVEFCVSGFDRWNVYNNRCRILR